MKKTIIILTVLLLFLNSFAQVEFGNYTNQSDNFWITSDSVCFDLTNYGCFITHIRGCGSYTLINDFIFIKTEEFPGEKSTFKRSVGSKDITEFFIANANSIPLAGVTIILEDSLGNTVSGAATNREGSATIEYQAGIERVRIVYLACDEIEFKYNPGYNYQVRLVEGNVSEHQTVVYEIVSSNSYNLELALINPDFITTKDTIRTLKRIKRINRKHKHSTNKLEKTVANKGV